MARTNKYASINFNHVYEKNLSSNNSNSNPTKLQSPPASSYHPNSSYSSPNNLYKNHLSSNRSHGRMLVLTRPTPKPVSTSTNSPLSPSPQIPPTHQPQVQVPDRNPTEPASDQISLRPLGRTGGSGSLSSGHVVGVSSPVVEQKRERGVGATVVSPKPDKFVPPHLRPGFAGREERPGPEVFRGKGAGQRQQQQQQQQQQGYYWSPGPYGEDARPKSGGYDRMRRGGESDPSLISRPRSSGSRPSSSG